MELNYRYSESTVKPSSLEVTEGTVYLRKDIAEVTRTSEQDDSIVYYTYQEAALSPAEFNEYTNLVIAENAIKGTEDSANIVSILVGQENGDGNQLAIMEAISDLYEMIALMTESA